MPTEFAGQCRLGLLDFSFYVRVPGLPHDGFATRFANNSLQVLTALHIENHWGAWVTTNNVLSE